jgi:hypothetical protein
MPRKPTGQIRELSLRDGVLSYSVRFRGHGYPSLENPSRAQQFSAMWRAEARQVPRGRGWFLHRFAMTDLTIRLAPFHGGEDHDMLTADSAQISTPPPPRSPMDALHLRDAGRP